MQYFLLDNLSSHLAGRDGGENKNAIFSPFFALESIKKRFIFCFVFSPKPMQKSIFLGKFFDFLHNILQISKLHQFTSAYFFHIKYAISTLNLLNYKILAKIREKNKEKCKKCVDFSLVF